MKDEWWFASGGARKGPVTFEFLRGKVLDGSLSTSDLVWTEGMSAWTPVSGVPELHQVMQALPPELPQSMAPEPPALSAPAAPWRRFFARFIDLWVIGLPTVFLVAFFLAPLWPGFALWLQQPGADVALGFLVIPLVLVIEAGIFGLFGTTLGKGLLGIHVKTSTAQKPSFSEYLSRQHRVYWYGLGTGFPLVSFFTYVRQYRRLKAGKTASYDEGLFTVTAEKIGFLRSAVAVTVVAALVVINSILQMISSVAEQRSPEVVSVSNNGLITEKDVTVSQSSRSIPDVSVNTELQPGSVFKDCVDCPEMVVIPEGSFTMGSNENDDEKPARSVSVRSFALGKFEVTQGQWKAIMGSNPSYFSQCGDNCPVEQVSWDNIQQYLNKLNQMTGQKYRLASEAEWEYAARAGSLGKWSFGDDKGALGQHAWFFANSYGRTQPVGQKQANALGLHDMHGNVSEWVQDVWHDNYAGAPTDESAWVTGGEPWRRVLRGGDWLTAPDSLRSAHRFGISPDYWGSRTGFRIARPVP